MVTLSLLFGSPVGSSAVVWSLGWFQAFSRGGTGWYFQVLLLLSAQMSLTEEMGAEHGWVSGKWNFWFPFKFLVTPSFILA